GSSAPRRGEPRRAPRLVGAAGGGWQLRGRPPGAGPPPPAEPQPAAAAADPGWDEEPPAAGHWREDKGALLLTMKRDVAAADPCPGIPAGVFGVVPLPQPARPPKKKRRGAPNPGADSDEPEAAAEALREPAYEPPEVLTRQVVASRGRWPAFAPLVAAAAWALAFQGAARRAFVGDGSANNWALPRRFFGSFVPVLDF